MSNPNARTRVAAKPATATPQGEAHVTRPDEATIEKPASPSTEDAKADNGVGQTNDLSKADLKDGGASAGTSANDKESSDLRALTSSRGPLSSDTASQVNQTPADVEANDTRSDAQKYADESADIGRGEPSKTVTPDRPDGRFPKVNFAGPFGVVATQVVDNFGREVCFVGSAHLSMAERENIAQFIAAKLNQK